jgi:hypothetical protein
MQFEAGQDEIRRAKAAHELFMVNLGAHLLLGPMGIFLDIGRLGILLPIFTSFLFIGYTLQRSRKLEPQQGYLTYLHWKLALRNYRFLLIGYGLTLLLLGISWLVEFSVDSASPNRFLSVALTRIGVMPTIIMVFACFVIENGALNQALRAEVADRLVQRYPQA